MVSFKAVQSLACKSALLRRTWHSALPDVKVEVAKAWVLQPPPPPHLPPPSRCRAWHRQVVLLASPAECCLQSPWLLRTPGLPLHTGARSPTMHESGGRNQRMHSCTESSALQRSIYPAHALFKPRPVIALAYGFLCKVRIILLPPEHTVFSRGSLPCYLPFCSSQGQNRTNGQIESLA